MLHLTIDSLIQLISNYGYAIVFPLSVIEGPAVCVLAGFAVSLGYLGPIGVFITLMLGDVVGDALYYALGRFGRKSFIDKYGKYLGLNARRIEMLESYFVKYHWQVLLIAKTQAVGSPALVAAGVAKAPFGKYLWYNTLGSLPKVLVLEIIGFYFGKSYAAINTYIGYVAAITFALLAASLSLAYAVHRNHKNRNKELKI